MKIRTLIPWCASILLTLAALSPLQAPTAQAATDTAFLKTWERTDQPVARGLVSRTWLLGPTPFYTAQETYGSAVGKTRQVQYYDKARLEINDPKTDRNDPWFVTSGLLVTELVSGEIQTGVDRFQPYVPANIPIAGDLGPGNALAPTYATLHQLSASPGGQRAEDRTGQPVSQTVDAKGKIGLNQALAGYATVSVYNTATGHNIPDVFWGFMNCRGLVLDGGNYVNAPVLDWKATTGLPISEPYWAKVTVAGQQEDVLVQAFERRVLTFTPSNPVGWQVEMGNVGRHYYLWRYESSAPRNATINFDDWELQVSSVTREKTLLGGRYLSPMTSEGYFVTVFLTVKNLADSARVLPDTRLVDSEGRTYLVDGLTSLYSAYNYYSKSGYIETIEPGAETQVVVGFEVDASAGDFRIRPADIEQPAISLGI